MRAIGHDTCLRALDDLPASSAAISISKEKRASPFWPFLTMAIVVHIFAISIANGRPAFPSSAPYRAAAFQAEIRQAPSDKGWTSKVSASIQSLPNSEISEHHLEHAEQNSANSADGYTRFPLPNDSDNQYLTANQLDQPAIPISAIELAMPTNTSTERQGGEAIILALWINANGIVDHAQALQPHVHDSLVNQFMKVFSEARYFPAKRNGQDVASLKYIRIEIPEN